MANSPFSQADLQVGDWIKFRELGGLERIAEVRSFYPFGTHGAVLVDTTLGHVALQAVMEVRKPVDGARERERASVQHTLRTSVETIRDHVCDRNGPRARIVDESDDAPIDRIAPTCAVCGKPQLL